MLTNFQEITKELTDIESQILPSIIKSFQKYTIENPIKEPAIVARFNESGMGVKLSGVRLRKIVNHIRCNKILPIIATSKGYFVSYDKDVIESQVESLRQRANSINNCADALEKFIK
jgi:hypothetical protein